MSSMPPDHDELDPLYAAVFTNPQNGTPDNITQAGCLVLARLGKDAWNTWRQNYPMRVFDDDRLENIANFSGFDFRNFRIDFQGFVLGNYVSFDGARFDNFASFCDAEFGDFTSFIGAKFKGDANFREAQFGDYTNFEKTQFRNYTDFSFTRFGDFASFEGAQIANSVNFSVSLFGVYAKFDGVQFGDAADFEVVLFDNHLSFEGAQFGNFTSFEGSQFDGNASFKGSQFGNDTNFEGAQFCGNANFSALKWASMRNHYLIRLGGLEAAKAWAEALGLSPETFKSISFNGAEFVGQADFSGRSFEDITSFGRLGYQMKVSQRKLNGKVIEKDLPEGLPVVFGSPPIFHNCKLHQDTAFDGAQFPAPYGSDTAARAYRTLKLA
ncbi:MAG: pentapeptide repeat-containing protein, partial [Methylococcaceae bacterium]